MSRVAEVGATKIDYDLLAQQLAHASRVAWHLAAEERDPDERLKKARWASNLGFGAAYAANPAAMPL